MTEHPYSPEWFDNLSKSSRDGALPVLQTLRRWFPEIRSVLDIGCGSGEWLKAAGSVWMDCEVLGVDHPETANAKLSVAQFQGHDLKRPLSLERSFDLVISLEVAEHLGESHADTFVDSLCRHGNLILFSAAIPFQGGTHHVNEQWPVYWVRKFETRGYHCHDVVRPSIWNDERVPYWYRQNALLFAAEQLDLAERDWGYQRIVHPEAFLAKADPRRVPGGHALRAFSHAVKRRLLRR